MPVASAEDCETAVSPIRFVFGMNAEMLQQRTKALTPARVRQVKTGFGEHGAHGREMLDCSPMLLVVRVTQRVNQGSCIRARWAKHCWKRWSIASRTTSDNVIPSSRSARALRRRYESRGTLINRDPRS